MGTLPGPRVISRAFFGRAPEVVAPELLGCVLTGGGVSVRLTEVEAYSGALDSASHAYRGRTERNAVMFGPPGFVYVYFTYGMHFCMNLVCLEPGVAGAVLLRAGEVVSGSSVAAARRGRATDLARGRLGCVRRWGSIGRSTGWTFVRLGRCRWCAVPLLGRC